MGKRRRFKKIKSVDPFAPKREVKEKEEKLQLKQRIPRTFTEMMERKKLFENGGNIKKEMKRKGESSQEMSERKKTKKRKGESNYRYMQRLSEDVDRALIAARNSAQECPEKKMDPTTGPKRTKVKTRLQTLKKKKQQKRIQKKEEEREKSRWTDRVEFGEVVTRPPALTTKPRKADMADKPGRRDLLLKSTLNQSMKSKESVVSMARKKALRDERDRVIQAYRDLKHQQIQSNT